MGTSNRKRVGKSHMTRSSDFVLLAVILSTAYLHGIFADEDASEDLIAKPTIDEAELENETEVNVQTLEQTLEHELSDSAGTEDWGVVKKAASAVKKHVVDPVKEHVVDPIAGGVFRHFVKTFNRLFREKMPEEACTKKSAADSNIAGFEQDVMLQQPPWSLKGSAVGQQLTLKNDLHLGEHTTATSQNHRRRLRWHRWHTHSPHVHRSVNFMWDYWKKAGFHWKGLASPAPASKDCVCMKNDKGKRFCCTIKTSTAQFVWQFTLWSIKSCTLSWETALKCISYAPYYLVKVHKIYHCFVTKAHKDVSKGDSNHAIDVVWRDIKASFSYLFGGEEQMNMLDGGNRALTQQDLDTPDKRLYRVTKAFLQASEDVLQPSAEEQPAVSPHDSQDHSLDKLLDTMDNSEETS